MMEKITKCCRQTAPVLFVSGVGVGFFLANGYLYGRASAPTIDQTVPDETAPPEPLPTLAPIPEPTSAPTSVPSPNVNVNITNIIPPVPTPVYPAVSWFRSIRNFIGTASVPIGGFILKNYRKQIKFVINKFVHGVWKWIQAGGVRAFFAILRFAGRVQEYKQQLRLHLDSVRDNEILKAIQRFLASDRLAEGWVEFRNFMTRYRSGSWQTEVLRRKFEELTDSYSEASHEANFTSAKVTKLRFDLNRIMKDRYLNPSALGRNSYARMKKQLDSIKDTFDRLQQDVDNAPLDAPGGDRVFRDTLPPLQDDVVIIKEPSAGEYGSALINGKEVLFNAYGMVERVEKPEVKIEEEPKTEEESSTKARMVDRAIDVAKTLKQVLQNFLQQFVLGAKKLDTVEVMQGDMDEKMKYLIEQQEKEEEEEKVIPQEIPVDDKKGKEEVPEKTIAPKPETQAPPLQVTKEPVINEPAEPMDPEKQPTQQYAFISRILEMKAKQRIGEEKMRVLRGIERERFRYELLKSVISDLPVPQMAEEPVTPQQSIVEPSRGNIELVIPPGETVEEIQRNAQSIFNRQVEFYEQFYAAHFTGLTPVLSRLDTQAMSSSLNVQRYYTFIDDIKARIEEFEVVLRGNLDPLTEMQKIAMRPFIGKYKKSIFKDIKTQLKPIHLALLLYFVIKLRKSKKMALTREMFVKLLNESSLGEQRQLIRDRRYNIEGRDLTYLPNLVRVNNLVIRYLVTYLPSSEDPFSPEPTEEPK